MITVFPRPELFIMIIVFTRPILFIIETLVYLYKELMHYDFMHVEFYSFKVF